MLRVGVFAALLCAHAALAKIERCTAPLLMDGKEMKMDTWEYVTTQHEPDRTIHTMTAKVIPCGGFLRDEPFYIRGAPATDAHVVATVLQGAEFGFLDSILGMRCYMAATLVLRLLLALGL